MCGVIDRIVSVIIRRYRAILLLCTSLALVSIGLLIRPGLPKDYRIEALVAANDAEYYRYRRFGEQFVSGEMALIVMDVGDPLEPNNLELSHRICQECRRIEGVESPLAVSEFPRLNVGAMLASGKGVQTVYEQLRQDPSARRRVESELRNNPLLQGNLLGVDSQTGKPTHANAVLVQVSGESSPSLRKHVVDQLRRVVAEAQQLRPNTTILLGGPLIGLMEIFEAIHRDLVIFSIVIFTLICTALWLIFRRKAMLMVTLTAAGISTLTMLGVSIACRMSTSLVSQTIVILVVIECVSMCVQLLVAHEENRRNIDGQGTAPLQGARYTMTSLFVPCTMSAVSTMFGFGSLLVSELLPIRHLAILGSAGVALGMLLAMSAIPAFSGYAARTIPAQYDKGLVNEALTRIARLSGTRRIWSVAVVTVYCSLLVLCAVKVPGALRNFENDYVKNFRENSNVRRVYRFVERNLCAVGSIEVILRRKDGQPVLGPKATQAIESLQRGRKGQEDRIRRTVETHVPPVPTTRPAATMSGQVMTGLALMNVINEFQGRVERELAPPIRKTLSLADVVKTAYVGNVLGLTMPQLPVSEAQFASTMALIQSMLSPELLRHFITEDRKALRINLRATESDDVYRKLDVARRVREMALQTFGSEYETEVTGLYPLYAKISVDILQSQLGSFTTAFLLIAGLMCAGLRSIRLGLISMIPNVIPMVLCLGLMGWTGIPVNMATAMMLSIALGIAVDNTAFYLWRFRRELAKDNDYAAAIVRSHGSVGIACTFNSIVIVGGFWVLCLSEFMPTIYFGLLIGLTMLGALAGIIFLLPVLLITLKPIRVERLT